MEEIIYNFDDYSKNQTYTIGTDTELPLRVEDTNIDNFDTVYVNNVLLDQKYFEVKTGSISLFGILGCGLFLNKKKYN